MSDNNDLSLEHIAAKLQASPNDIDLWLLIAKRLDDPEKKKYCYNRVLSLDPENELAQKCLQVLSNPPANQITFTICPLCGFPNSLSDIQCKRCHTSLDNVVKIRSVSRPVVISSISDLTVPSYSIDTPPKVSPDIEKGLSLAMQYQQRGDKYNARDVLRNILSKDNHNEQAWLLFSEVSENTEYEIQCLNNVLKINPENVQAKLRLQEINYSKDLIAKDPEERIVPNEVNSLSPLRLPVYLKNEQAPSRLSELGQTSPPHEDISRNTKSDTPSSKLLLSGVIIFILASVFILASAGIFLYFYSKINAITTFGYPSHTTQLSPTITSPPPTETRITTGNWKLFTQIDEFDDSTRVYLDLPADYPVQGRLTEQTPKIQISCHHQSLYLMIWLGMFPELNSNIEVVTHWRFDNDDASTDVLDISDDGEWLQVMYHAEDMIRTMESHKILLFGFTPLNASRVSTTFSLEGLSAALILLREKCS